MIHTRQLFGANSLGMDTVVFNDSPTCCKTCWILLQGCQAICKSKSGAFVRVVDACERLKLLCKLHSTLREKLSLEPSRTDAFITKLRWKRTLRSADRTLTHRQSHQQALQALDWEGSSFCCSYVSWAEVLARCPRQGHVASPVCLRLAASFAPLRAESRQREPACMPGEALKASNSVN